MHALPPTDMTNLDRWQERVGHRIKSIELDTKFACDAVINFHDAPPVWLAARYDQPPLPLDPGGDDLIIAFDEPTARQLGLHFCAPE